MMTAAAAAAEVAGAAAEAAALPPAKRARMWPKVMADSLATVMTWPLSLSSWRISIDINESNPFSPSVRDWEKLNGQKKL
jgi:hypothetical protein